MKFVLDAHTHTLASGHAYNTITEMAAAAKAAGLQALGITEHGPTVPGSCHPIYYSNSKILDRHSLGIELLMGVEMNILDYDGTVDVAPNYLRWIDIGIAGAHPPVAYTPGTRQENTAALLKAMHNPDVDVISHPDDSRVPVNFDELARAAAESGVLLELNNASLHPLNIRSKGNPAAQMLRLMESCYKHRAHVLVSSDAHCATEVGKFTAVEALLQQAGFPEELIVNTSLEKLKKHLHRFNMK